MEQDRGADWESDPEAQYRAGFEEGALALFHAVETQLSPSARNAVRAWLGLLDAWRLKSRQEVARGLKPELVYPPEIEPRSN
jgi:hypothetical protein